MSPTSRSFKVMFIDAEGKSHIQAATAISIWPWPGFWIPVYRCKLNHEHVWNTPVAIKNVFKKMSGGGGGGDDDDEEEEEEEEDEDECHVYDYLTSMYRTRR